MSKIALVAAASVAVAAAAPLTESQYQSLFSRFVSQYEKQYETNSFFTKYNTFKANLDSVMAHNAQNLSWTQQMNQFGDLSAAEFDAFLRLHSKNAPVARAALAVSPKSNGDVVVDWVKEGKVNAVKNQGQCGSCWAFSAVAALETEFALKSGKLLSLSEQELVDCSGAYGNAGCAGGLMTSAFEYTTDNGLSEAKDYPYVARDTTCKAAQAPRAIQTTGYKTVTGGEAAVVAAAESGVLAIAVAANSLQFYSGGVIEEGCTGQLNHGVALVAVDTTTNIGKVRNSWGAAWGEQGYYRFKIGKNSLCYTADVSIPTF